MVSSPRIVSYAQQHLKANRDLVSDFFLVFARFEFAMKQSGLLKKGKEDAQPDWDRLAAIVPFKSDFEQLASPEVSAAFARLTEQPPKKQVIKDGRPSWAEANRSGEPRTAKELLAAVRRTRNNLFHGGKFPGVVVASPERNELLLRDCLVILDHALRCAPAELRAAFEEGPQTP